MQDIRLAVFDWDGTLMDSVGRIVACVQGGPPEIVSWRYLHQPRSGRSSD